MLPSFCVFFYPPVTFKEAEAPDLASTHLQATSSLPKNRERKLRKNQRPASSFAVSEIAF